MPNLPSMYEESDVERTRSPPPAYNEQSGPSVDPCSALAVQGHPELNRATSSVDPAPPSNSSTSDLTGAPSPASPATPRIIPRNPSPVVLTWSRPIRSIDNDLISTFSSINETLVPTLRSTTPTLDDPNRLAGVSSTSALTDPYIILRNTETSRIVSSIPSPGTQATASTSTGQSSRHRDVYYDDSHPPMTAKGPILYTFSPISANAMILVPPATYPDSRPVYHISWREDYFNPGSLVTTVRRGGHEGGRYVGEFDLRNNTRVGSVRIGNVEKWIDDVIIVTYKHRGMCKFVFSKQLFWDRRKSVAGIRFCRLEPESNEYIARFVPPSRAIRSFDALVCKLEVYPLGLKYFDEILISSLIMERQKVTGVGLYAVPVVR